MRLNYPDFLFRLFAFVCAGLHCCAGFPLAAVNRGYPLVAVHELLIAVTSLVVEHGLWACRLQLQHMGSIVVAPRL